MSTRAYRINKIEYEGAESFNLWDDKKLMDFLDREYGFCEHLDMSGGIGEVSVEVLEKAIKELDLDDCIVARLKRDIEWAKNRDEEYIQYYCF